MHLERYFRGLAAALSLSERSLLPGATKFHCVQGASETPDGF